MWLIAALLLIPPPTHSASADNEEALLVALSIHLDQSFEPGHATYQVRILPHQDNYWFCVGWDNTTTAKGRTSCQPLNGIYGPLAFYIEYRALERGCYRGFVDLYRVPHYRAATATTQFRIGSAPCA